ncbi:hypothetical protein D1816_03400 [Aquimarina sp. AD10]|nr:hypothetical protein D1816_03400 [Aquimarina sp. AD10]RKN00336.1 hypothetical protein D7033_08230 [Aquimarina sp. AD10]
MGHLLHPKCKTMNFKITIKTVIFLLLLQCIVYTEVKAQDCNAVPFMKVGAVLEYTDYNKKGKLQGTTRHETTAISPSTDGIVNAVIKATVVDNKNKDKYSTDYNVKCNYGLFSVDMLRFFDFDKLSEHNKNNLNIKIDGDVLEFPYQMKPGDDLDDGTINIKINNEDNTFTLVTLSFDVLNREIVGEEQITTPAGTYKCKKVTFDFESKFGILNIRGSGVEWYYNDVMVVRSESYNKKGKLIGYHELTKVL